MKQSYWEGTGKYSKELEELTSELVPSSGKATSVKGEVLRAINRIAYDYYNNGCGNIFTAIIRDKEFEIECFCEGLDEYCTDCDGSGIIYEVEQIVEEVKVESFWQKFFDTIVAEVPESSYIVNRFLGALIVAYEKGSIFEEEVEQQLTNLIDFVMEWLLTQKQDI